MLAFKLAIFDQCQSILLCVRILLANLTPFSTTSETLSYTFLLWQFSPVGIFLFTVEPCGATPACQCPHCPPFICFSKTSSLSKSLASSQWCFRFSHSFVLFTLKFGQDLQNSKAPPCHTSLAMATLYLFLQILSLAKGQGSTLPHQLAHPRLHPAVSQRA